MVLILKEKISGNTTVIIKGCCLLFLHVEVQITRILHLPYMSKLYYLTLLTSLSLHILMSLPCDLREVKFIIKLHSLLLLF